MNPLRFRCGFVLITPLGKLMGFGIRVAAPLSPVIRQVRLGYRLLICTRLYIANLRGRWDGI
jgi:hypothetical protein